MASPFYSIAEPGNPVDRFIERLNEWAQDVVRRTARAAALLRCPLALWAVRGKRTCGSGRIARVLSKMRTALCRHALKALAVLSARRNSGNDEEQGDRRELQTAQP